jgi:hypothetical protein
MSQVAVQHESTTGRQLWLAVAFALGLVLVAQAAAAMDSFLKRQAGPNAHLWDMVVAEVFQPIGIFHLPTRHTQEADGTPGIPPLGYGLYPNVDDIGSDCAGHRQ